MPSGARLQAGGFWALGWRCCPSVDEPIWFCRGFPFPFLDLSISTVSSWALWSACSLLCSAWHLLTRRTWDFDVQMPLAKSGQASSPACLSWGHGEWDKGGCRMSRWDLKESKKFTSRGASPHGTVERCQILGLSSWAGKMKSVNRWKRNQLLVAKCLQDGKRLRLDWPQVLSPF